MVKKSALLVVVFLMIATVASAAQPGKTVNILVSSVKLFFNGEEKKLSSQYSILNDKGHTYVPLRFLIENMGGKIAYDEKRKQIQIQSEQPSLAIDPNVENIAVKELRVTPSGDTSEVGGNLEIRAKKGEKVFVSGLLTFYGHNANKLGTALFGDYYAGGINRLEVISKTRDLSRYRAVTLQIGKVDDKQYKPLIGDQASDQEVQTLLNRFYQSYAGNKLEDLINYHTNKNKVGVPFEQLQAEIAQMFMNDRHWAGDIKKHQIAAVYDVDAKTKEVLVTVEAVTTSGNRRTVDRLILNKQKKEWLIDEFVSGTQPELP